MTLRYQWVIGSALASATALAPQIAYCARYLSVEAARVQSFPTATNFQAVTASSELRATIEQSAGRFSAEPRIFRVSEGSMPLGWFVIDEVIGKLELITYSVAIAADGSVASIDVLEYRESHGDAIRLPAWRKQFVGRRARQPLRLDNEIRNISGATLSCRHVTEGVNRVLLLVDSLSRNG
jgi:Na+-translocating ferredoxin:NAD+ oxidoreductase RnfG subunit